MKITFLGTSAGSVPLGERRHASFVLEQGDGLYWIDAGEGCSRTAHLAGLDVLKTRGIFITHMAMDHIGGLPHLLWAIRKVNDQHPDRPLAGKEFHLLIPHAVAWHGVIEMVEATTHCNFARDFVLRVLQYHDGKAFDDGVLRVTACHNSHQGKPFTNRDWRSYGFRLEAAGKAVVYTGDVDALEETEPLFRDPCDLAVVDASHRNLEAICAFLGQGRFSIRRLVLFHLNAKVQADPAAAVATVKKLLGLEPLIPAEGQSIEL
jgi:ribonuclease BN (tRNA processing enzyme)